MNDWPMDEIEKVDEHITHIMFDMCEVCRFMAALRIIESIDIELIQELQDYIEDERLSDPRGERTCHPIPQPKHKSGGCFVHCREETR